MHRLYPIGRALCNFKNTLKSQIKEKTSKLAQEIPKLSHLTKYRVRLLFFKMSSKVPKETVPNENSRPTY